MISFKKVFLIMASVAFSLPLFASAQASSTSTPQPIPVIFADVNFTNVRATTTSNKITGSYVLEGSMGKQNDINIGIVAYDEKNSMVDTMMLKQGASVQQGEKLTSSFSYSIPAYLKGKIIFYLKAETSSGLPLSISKIGTETLSGAGSPISCSLTDVAKAVITCIAQDAVTAHIAYSSGSIFGNLSNETTKDLKKGEKYSFTPELPAGRYVAHISTDTNGGVAVVFVMPGAYGKISNLTVSSLSQGALHIVTMSSVSERNATINITLNDKSGAVCGSATQKISTSASQFDIASNCVEGTITADLVSEKGDKLDSKSEPFSVLTLSPPSPKKSMSQTELYAIIGLLVLLVLSYVFIRMKSGPRQVVVTAMFLLLIASGAGRAQAYSYSLAFTNCSGPCPAGAEINGNVNTSGGPYAAGQPVDVSVFMISGDNPQYPSGVDPVVKVSTSFDTTNYGADLFPSTYTQAQMMSGIANGVNITAPSTYGTHYINWLASSAGYNTVTGSTAVPIQAYCIAMQGFAPDAATWQYTDYTLYPGQSVQLQDDSGSSPHKWSASCSSYGTTCPITLVTRSTPNTVRADCGAVAGPTVDVHFSLLQKMFSVFAAERP